MEVNNYFFNATGDSFFPEIPSEVYVVMGVVGMTVLKFFTGTKEEREEDFAPSFVPTREEVESAQIEERNNSIPMLVHRETMVEHPLFYVPVISSHLREQSEFTVSFSGEEGVDATGLTKEFFTAWFDALKAGKDQGILEITKSDFSDQGVAPLDFYHVMIREVFKVISKKPEVMVEEFVDPGMVRDLFALPESVWQEGFSSFAKDGLPSGEIVRKLCAIWNEHSEDSGTKDFYRKSIQYLESSESLCAELKEFVDEIEGEELEVEDLSLEQIESWYSQKLSQYLSNEFSWRSMNSFYFMYALCAGVDGEIDLASFRQSKANAENGNIFPKVQGSFDRSRVIDALVLSESVGRSDRLPLQQKVDRLKHALETIATTEEVKMFARYVTGKTVFGDRQTIKVVKCEENWKYLSAQTCFDIFSLYVPVSEGVDDTDERLLRAVLSRMQKMEFLGQ